MAEYYQQQVEMLEGFTEMDALAERGFVPRMSAVCIPFSNDLKSSNNLPLECVMLIVLTRRKKRKA